MIVDSFIGTFWCLYRVSSVHENIHADFEVRSPRDGVRPLTLKVKKSSEFAGFFCVPVKTIEFFMGRRIVPVVDSHVPRALFAACGGRLQLLTYHPIASQNI
jgi:hypothetical protein